MKILVLSDSHAAMFFMRRCIQNLRPDAVIHLGDYYDDALALREEFFHLPVYAVAGNCDRYRCPPDTLQTVCCNVGGVRLFMTHGHLHYVKSGIGALTADARRHGAAAVLYGHTHRPDCHRQEDGLWVLNPGCSGSAGVVVTDGEKITACYLVRQAELEDIL